MQKTASEKNVTSSVKDERKPSRRRSSGLRPKAAGVAGKKRSAKQAHVAHETALSSSADNRRARFAVLFAHLDTSGDHEIDKQEFLNAAASWTDDCPRIHAEDLDDFGEWDADGDGVLCEGEFFCFCDALWQIIGEREFLALEAKAMEHAQQKALASPKTESASPLPEAPQVRDSTTSCTTVLDPAVYGLSPIALKADGDLRLAMADAASKEGRKALRKAINAARSSGVDRQLVDDAVHLVRKIEVEEVLQRSMDSKNPKLLKVAIMNVSHMGADAQMVREAEALLGLLETREFIKSSIATKDPDMIKIAIAKAVQTNIDPSEIQDARLMENRMRMHQEVDTALKSRDVAELTRLNSFMRSLASELQDPSTTALLDQAERALPIIHKELEAKKRLDKALCTGTIQEIKEAIDGANDCGGNMVEEVTRARLVLGREEAREFLVKAIKGEKRTILKKALDAAMEFELDMPEIDIAEKLLKKLDASRDISLALNMSKDDETPLVDLQALKQMLIEAKLQGVETGKVMKAEQLIAMMEEEGHC